MVPIDSIPHPALPRRPAQNSNASKPANLSSPNLSNANQSNANQSNANLSSSNLSSPNLSSPGRLNTRQASTTQNTPGQTALHQAKPSKTNASKTSSTAQSSSTQNTNTQNTRPPAQNTSAAARNPDVTITKQNASPPPVIGYSRTGHTVRPEALPTQLLEGLARLNVGSGRPTLLPLNQGWTNLSLLLNQTSNEDGTPSLFKNILPNTTDRNLAARIARYLNLLQNGKLPEIFEKELNTLNQHPKNIQQLATNVKKELSNILHFSKTPLQDSNGQEWRSLLVPFYHHSHITHLRLYSAWKEQKQRQKREKEEEKRFIVETLFSALGPLQLDTLQSHKHIRILFRTHNILPEDWKKGIERAFIETLETMATSGDIIFQSVKEFPVTLADTSHRKGFYA